MQTYPLVLFVMTTLASGAGLMGIVWCRADHMPCRARWGRRLFLSMLGLLGAACLLLALQPHRGLLYLGLAVGALMIVMLWESRTEARTRAVQG